MTLNSLDSTRSAAGETGQLERTEPDALPSVTPRRGRSAVCLWEPPPGTPAARFCVKTPLLPVVTPTGRTAQTRPNRKDNPLPVCPPKGHRACRDATHGDAGSRTGSQPGGGHVGQHHTPERLEHTTRASAAGVTRGHRGQRGRGDLLGSPCSIWLAAATSRVNTAAERLQTEPVRPVRAGASAPAPKPRRCADDRLGGAAPPAECHPGRRPETGRRCCRQRWAPARGHARRTPFARNVHDRPIDADQAHTGGGQVDAGQGWG